MKARRAFWALKGIIRLQALIRGHLVRRQAVATLFSVMGIVRLQAFARGREIRKSDIGVQVYRKCRLQLLQVMILSFLCKFKLTLKYKLSRGRYSSLGWWGNNC